MCSLCVESLVRVETFRQKLKLAYKHVYQVLVSVYLSGKRSSLVLSFIGAPRAEFDESLGRCIDKAYF